jgi:thiamine-monophosphate kinase
MDRGLSEFDLIDRLRRQASVGGPLLTGLGDDASVTEHAGPTATSVDAVVEGVHFNREWSSPDRIARKAVATALSDLAAMAADPGEVYVTLGLPRDTGTGWLEQLADGFVSAAAEFGAVLAGGDTVASPVLFAAVTVVGRAAEGEVLVLRSGAAAGDLVAVTGSFGGAAAGLLLLEGGWTGADDDRPDAQLRAALVERHVSPRPLLEAGRRLRGSGVTALIDVSDGLAADLGHIAEESGVRLSIDAGLVPVQPGVQDVAGPAGRDALDLALGGGEDYELAMTFPRRRLESVRESLGETECPLTVVGVVEAGSGVEVSGGSAPAGFDHFR